MSEFNIKFIDASDLVFEILDWDTENQIDAYDLVKVENTETGDSQYVTVKRFIGSREFSSLGSPMERLYRVMDARPDDVDEEATECARYDDYLNSIEPSDLDFIDAILYLDTLPVVYKADPISDSLWEYANQMEQCVAWESDPSTFESEIKAQIRMAECSSNDAVLFHAQSIHFNSPQEAADAVINRISMFVDSNPEWTVENVIEFNEALNYPVDIGLLYREGRFTNEHIQSGAMVLYLPTAAAGELVGKAVAE